MITEATQKYCQDFAFIEVDQVKVKGKTKEIRFYGLLGDVKLKEQPAFKEFEKQWEAFLALFEAKKRQEAQEALHGLRDLDCSTFAFVEGKSSVLLNLYQKAYR